VARRAATTRANATLLFSLIVSVERLVGGSACGDELGAFAVRFAAR
jgi:hypothetical protein